jgi:hypothetical protein
MSVYELRASGAAEEEERMVEAETRETVLRIRIQDPGSGAFWTPGSGIRDPE